MVVVSAEDRMTVVVEDDRGAMLNFVLSTDCDWLQLAGKDQLTGGEEQKNRQEESGSVHCSLNEAIRTEDSRVAAGTPTGPVISNQ